MKNRDSSHQPEAFSRVLIDRALSDSEWDLLNPQQVQFEFHTPTGRADYLLVALRLHKMKGLPDISDLLRKLNDARKAAAYGDIELPELDAKDTAAEIEEYVEAVAALLEGGKK